MKYALKCHETIPTCHANSVIFQFEQTEITAMLCLMQNATENKMLVLKIPLKELERKEKYFKEFKCSWENPFVVNIIMSECILRKVQFSGIKKKFKIST